MKNKLFLTIALLFLFSGNSFAQDTVSSKDANNFIGETKIVKGKIAEIHVGGKTINFNFDNVFPEQTIVAVIFKDKNIDYDKIKEGSILTISGKIELYKEKPEIIINEQSQIIKVE